MVTVILIHQVLMVMEAVEMAGFVNIVGDKSLIWLDLEMLLMEQA